MDAVDNYYTFRTVLVECKEPRFGSSRSVHNYYWFRAKLKQRTGYHIKALQIILDTFGDDYILDVRFDDHWQRETHAIELWRKLEKIKDLF